MPSTLHHQGTHTPPTVACPTCGSASVFAPSNPWRPFCSQRCKQVDLGAWAAEEFRVPSAPATEQVRDEPSSQQHY